MNTRQTWIFGLAALGLALAGPVQAAPDFMDGAFIVAKNDRGDEVRKEPHDSRKGVSPDGMIRCMAYADGYVMVRRKGCVPWVMPEDNVARAESVNKKVPRGTL